MNPAQYEAARTAAAIVSRAARGRILVAGKDAAPYLHGLLTNDIAGLRPGEGCYAAYLTAQGRMISDLWVYQLGDVVLVSLGRDVTAAVLAKFDQFVFSEDVQLGDVSDTFGAVALVGPLAGEIVSAIVSLPSGDARARIEALPEHGNVRGVFDGEAAIVLRVTDTGEPGYEVLVDAARLPALIDRFHERGAVDVDEATAEVLRVEAGVPLFHRDMDEETIPLEAGIESRAISLTKGCYVGQEVIIRVLHRGHGRVARKLVGLRIEAGDPPPIGAAIASADREIGHVTSAVHSPAVGSAIGLGYVHRDFAALDTDVTVAGARARVVAVPFR